jgi:hypothetical protein
LLNKLSPEIEDKNKFVNCYAFRNVVRNVFYLQSYRTTQRPRNPQLPHTHLQLD